MQRIESLSTLESLMETLLELGLSAILILTYMFVYYMLMENQKRFLINLKARQFSMDFIS